MNTQQLGCLHLHVSKVASYSPFTANEWRCDICKLLLHGELKPLVIEVVNPAGPAATFDPNAEDMCAQKRDTTDHDPPD